MTVFFVGLNHRTAGVDLRERFSLTPSQSSGLFRRLVKSPPEKLVTEAVILSTCNRCEVFASAGDSQGAAMFVREKLAESLETSVSECQSHLLHAHGADAVRHLCTLAAGLDSMILGEPQILGQVVGAHEAALACEASGPVLSTLFRKAIECGKRARAETAISEHATSVSHVAVELARQIFGSLDGQPVLLVGAGEMAEVAARNLFDNGTRNLMVVNRNWERAQRLAGEFNGTAHRWEDLSVALSKADIVISSTGAQRPIISQEMVRSVMHRRRQRPLFLIDISVPRNVEPDVGRLPSVYLYDIDDLQTVVQENRAQREREIPKVEAIVSQCVEEFLAWQGSRGIVPTIRDLRGHAAQICEAEVARALRRMGPLSDRDEKVLRGLAHGIMNKILHSPTVRLKELATQGDGFAYASIVRDLFDLSPTERGDTHD